MIKKSILVRETKRKALIKKYFDKRNLLRNKLKNAKTLNEIFFLNKILQKFPKNSIPIRSRNRCWKTGKARGFFRYFGVCRNVLREFAHACFLPGIIKASW